MVNRIRFACDPKIILIPLSSILPVKKLTPGIDKTSKYRRIAASVQEVGIIEPLVVYPQINGVVQYILLDGHIRLEILKEIGTEKVKCLVALDDEGFTYNHKVNPISPIQEHFMILEAIRHGVSEERIAKTLAVDVAAIRRKAVVEDPKTPPPDQAAFRVDFPAWLDSLTKRSRKITLALARSESTTEVAKRFRVTSGRVSQLRRELAENWEEFVGDTDDDDPTVAA